MRYDESLAYGSARLKHISDTPDLEAQWLLAFVLAVPASKFHGYPEKQLENSAWQTYQRLVTEREQGVPIAYLIGSAGFWSLDMTINKSVLIPRPESELLVEWALKKTRHQARGLAIDLGCGSGAIGLAFAKERPLWRVLCTDVSTQALALTQHNAKKNNITNVQTKKSNWLVAVSQVADCIISNPPYLAQTDHHMQHLQDPYNALVAGKSGLEHIEQIIKQAHNHLKKNGWLLLEHGFNQARSVRTLLAGWRSVQSKPDLNQIERITTAQKNN